MKVYVPFEFKMTGLIEVEASGAGEAFEKGITKLESLTLEEIMKTAEPDWDTLDVNMDESIEDEYGGAVFTGYEEC